MITSTPEMSVQGSRNRDCTWSKHYHRSFLMAILGVRRLETPGRLKYVLNMHMKYVLNMHMFCAIGVSYFFRHPRLYIVQV